MKNRKTVWMVLFSLLLAALFLVGCSSEEPTEAPAEPEAVEPTPEPVDVLPTAVSGEATLTAKENVRVRSGPGQQYPVYKEMAGGQTAKLLGISTSGSYYAIELPVVAPYTGWVDAEFAEVSNTENLPILVAPPVPPTAEFVGVQAGDPTVIADDAVFLRSGPGDQYPAYGVAEAGSKGLVFGVSEDGEWWVVRVNPEVIGKGYAWVQKELVSTENVPEDLTVIKTPPLPTTGKLPSPDPNGPYGIATDFLNVRSGPGADYPVLVVVAPEASGEIIGKSADGAWWQVKVSTDISADGLAWVHGAYVNAFNVDDVPVVEAPPVPPDSPDAPEGALPCVLISQFPEDGTVFDAGTAFDMVWEVQNVGTDTWTTADAVISKLGAAVDQPLSTVDTLPLTQDVETEGTYIVTIPMTAPDTAGQFGEYWSIMLDEQMVCYFYNVIQVQE